MNSNAPLAERLRPDTLNEYIGQEHLLGKGKPLRKVLEANLLHSMIFWGPPGVGKTTLALLIAKHAKREFYSLSAISSGVKDLRDIISKPHDLFTPIVFIDEIHRFNKSQQDALLGAVEKGKITLIGATTENPSFEVNRALLSRCQVYILEAFGAKELEQIVKRAFEQDSILKKKKVEYKSLESMYRISGGDGRKLLNLIELVVNAQFNEKKIVISDELVEEIVQKNIAHYDKSGEQHYDIISAFIKSIRGSDPNAAVYWLARMIHGGEDPIFIARRMVIAASEDIGLANPTALVMANACMDAVHKIGYPESRIILSQTVIYLATSAKSNSAYVAIDTALALAEKTSHLPVPLHLRNAPTKLMKEIGYGKDYKYAHNYQDNFVKQHFMPEDIKDVVVYEPGANAKEAEIKRKQDLLWKG